MTVSVIIPTYNYANYIENAIESIINQTYPTKLIEIIVVDDGSTDKTKDILKHYIDTKRIQYIYQVNKGKAAATALGVTLCTGEIFFNLDADDFFLPNKISDYVYIFENHPNVVHVGSKAECIDHKGNFLYIEKFNNEKYFNSEVNGKILLKHFLQNNVLWGGGSTYACRLRNLKEFEIPSNVDMYIDEYLVLSILAFGNSYCFNEPLSAWRIHNLNYSKNTLNAVKQKRLLLSSLGTLNALRSIYLFDISLIRLYELKHEVRQILYRELIGQKTITDMISLLHLICNNRIFNIKVLKAHHVFNRLIPTCLISLLKIILKKS